jgi:hypothetical protein
MQGSAEVVPCLGILVIDGQRFLVSLDGAVNLSQADSDRSWGDLRGSQPLDQARRNRWISIQLSNWEL